MYVYEIVCLDDSSRGCMNACDLGMCVCMDAFTHAMRICAYACMYAMYACMYV